jgi:hypothetical protein
MDLWPTMLWECLLCNFRHLQGTQHSSMVTISISFSKWYGMMRTLCCCSTESEIPPHLYVCEVWRQEVLDKRDPIYLLTLSNSRSSPLTTGNPRSRLSPARPSPSVATTSLVLRQNKRDLDDIEGRALGLEGMKQLKKLAVHIIFASYHAESPRYLHHETHGVAQ